MKKNTAPKTIQDSFIDEINEDLKNENLKKIWDKYGLYIILLVVSAIVTAVSFESIKSWRIKHHQDASNVYALAQNLRAQGRLEDSNKILSDLEKNANGIYADIAQVQIANNLAEEGKPEEAMVILEKITLDEDISRQVRDVATIKLASLKLENAPASEIEVLLNPMIATPGNWTAIAKTMLAMLAIREQNFPKAIALYEEVSNDGYASESLKNKAQDMISLLNEKRK